MSNLSQFVGGAKVPKLLVNKTSTNGSGADSINYGAAPAGAKAVDSGALTSNTLATVLSVTGSGVISLMVCAGVNDTSRTHRFKMTLDGVVVYDATTAAIASTNYGINLVGAANPSATVQVRDPIPFNSSLLIEYASSLTETGLTRFSYVYRTN